MKIDLPALSLVVLVGPSGSGKSTFARRHFKPTEVLSSDACRGLVSDDETNQAVTTEAFEVLHFIARKRLKAGKLTVVDATNVQPEARRPLVALAREHHVLPVAIVLDLPQRLCQDRNQGRADRAFGPGVIHRQCQDLHRSQRYLQQEGFRHIYTLRSPEEVEQVVLTREPLWNDLRHETGPFDIVGDIHGCLDELTGLLGRLGYRVEPGPDGHLVTNPPGRKAVFLGDLVDRGPDTPGVLKLVMRMVEQNQALCVPGNHEMKLMRKLRGKEVKVNHGLEQSLEQLARHPPEFSRKVADFIDGLVSHYLLDGGRLVVAHAGMKEELQGRGSGRVRDFALYGETTGETDEYGLPVRYNWAGEYKGKATVVYGHTPVPEPEWLNHTVCVDTGCVFGGKLTALRYPEREFVSVPAARVYCQPKKPLGNPAPQLTAQQERDELLDLSDVSGKRTVETGLIRNIVIREENAAAALEVMSRFAVDPRWLVYLPPTMSPSETSRREGYLEHPAEAFAYFAREGAPRVVCQEKHMGSRAVVVVCRDAEVARTRFGSLSGEVGVVYTRTGRRFFTDPALEQGLLTRLRAAFQTSGLWDELKTGWAVLDCELMPWSLKAQELVRNTYAAVGTAAQASLEARVAVLRQAAAAGVPVGDLLPADEQRASAARRYQAAYQQYCWPVQQLTDLKLAPFHLLATEGQVHTGQDHLWHLATLARLCAADPGVLLATRHLELNPADPQGQEAGLRFFEEITSKGGEGMVVKPLSFVNRSDKGLSQPALKVRGQDYLRIIYGPEYTLPENLERLRSRGLSAKRNLALREFSLGLEGLERFVRRDPLRRIHECVFAVLALESEPVDPRL